MEVRKTMATPQVYEQIVQVYGIMEKKAVDGTFKGHVTPLFEEAGLGLSVYTTVMRRLQSMGCVRRLSRGARNVPSEWELIREPTLELFNSSTDRRRSRYDALRKDYIELKSRVDALEERIDGAQERGMPTANSEALGNCA
jgi:hypothetical protein